MAEAPRKPITPTVRARGPQRKDDYSYARDAKTNPFGVRGNYILRPDGPPVQLLRPNWDKGKFPTVVKLLPAVDPEIEGAGQLLPYRVSGEPDMFTDFLRSIPVASYVGHDRQISFVLYNPRAVYSGYDSSTNPYVILAREIASAVKEDEAMLGDRNVITTKWHMIEPGSKHRKERALTWPSSRVYANAAVYLTEDDAYTTPLGLRNKDKPVLLEMSSSAGDKLCGLLNLQLPGYSGSTSDYEKAFRFGDITRLDGGRFVTLYNKKHHKDVADFTCMQQPLVDFFTNFQDEDDDNAGDFNSWRVALHKQVRFRLKGETHVISAGDLANYVDRVIEQHVWFMDVLNIPDADKMDDWHLQICTWLASCFRTLPDILLYGWRDNPEYLNSDVMGILRSRTTGPSAEIPTDADDKPARQIQSRILDESLEGMEGLPEEGVLEDDVAGLLEDGDDAVYEESAETLLEEGEDSLEEGLPAEGELSEDDQVYEEAVQEESLVEDDVAEAAGSDESLEDGAFVEGEEGIPDADDEFAGELDVLESDLVEEEPEAVTPPPPKRRSQAPAVRPEDLPKTQTRRPAAAQTAGRAAVKRTDRDDVAAAAARTAQPAAKPASQKSTTAVSRPVAAQTAVKKPAGPPVAKAPAAAAAVKRPPAVAAKTEEQKRNEALARARTAAKKR